ncbi:FixH family protein [Candidatus Parabeggiatoa sp. HSG14]|uniref:FixH family protein n=1 Tax=Candidatus Parabeggiatoa sp. HSG14 TaxID=3055593 RepID=UPI0025A6CC1F|nr:FixH family protein [Thiotrichales bacterium HSG14]
MKPSWYQEPFVWLLILFPASAVIGGIITISLAISSSDGLVVDDYYKQGLEINRVLKRDKAALKHGLQAILTVNAGNQFIHLTLNANDSYKLPKAIMLQFSHSTRSGFDKQVMLKRISDNIYQSIFPSLKEGIFILQIIADDWRLLKSTHLPITEKVIFNDPALPQV